MGGFPMTRVEMAILVGFGVPIVLLTGAFIVLATWLQINDELSHSKA